MYNSFKCIQLLYMILPNPGTNTQIYSYTSRNTNRDRLTFHPQLINRPLSRPTPIVYRTTMGVVPIYTYVCCSVR